MPWRGPKKPNEFPTLGYQVGDWIEDWCIIPDGPRMGEPYELTPEMWWFLLQFYRLDPETGLFVHRRGGQLVRPQKWGKGPFSAAVVCAEAASDCVLFSHWDDDGEPVGRGWATPWIQITAVSEDQTANVFRALIPMIENGPLSDYIPDVGDTRINLRGGGRIEPVTASARSRLGQRVTFLVQDETHSWTKLNGGRALADNQRRNLAGMGGRFMEPLALDTPVPTPSGPTTVGALQAGDLVFGSDGRAVPVEGVTPVFLGQDCYRVTFDDGEEIVASASHGWTVRKTHRKKARSSVVTCSTVDLIAMLADSSVSVPVVPVEGIDNSELPVDPYYLGVWLGDGDAGDATVCCRPALVGEMVELLSAALPEYEEIVVSSAGGVARLRPRRKSRLCRWGHEWSDDVYRNGTLRTGRPSITCRKCGRGEPRQSSPLLTTRERLRLIGVLGDKHIPDRYLRSSLNQRLALLCGLMDSDGTITKNGWAAFSNTSAVLIEQVVELAVSVGYKTFCSWYDRPGSKPEGRVSFRPSVDVPVCRLSYKVERHRSLGSSGVNGRRFIRSVEPVESVPTRCIRIATHDHLFLVGRRGTPTHNTTNAWDPAEESVAQMTNEHPGGTVYIDDVEPGPGSIKNKVERRKCMKQVYKDSLKKGDQGWVDLDRIEAEVIALIEQGDAAQAERYFLNRKQASEGAAFDIHRWAELADATKVIADKEQIVIGVDGARWDDALAIVATHLESGHQWPLGIWERPRDAGDDYEHPLEDVDGVMLDAFARFDVWRAYVDPQKIEHLVDRWAGRWNQGSDTQKRKIVEWFTNRPKQVAYAIRTYNSAIQGGDMSHDGDSLFARHVANARKQMLTVKDEDGRPMWTISKDRRGSPRKIDAAMAGVLSWEARGDAIAAGALKKRSRKVAGF